jgi:hypothetical protein
MGDAGNNKNNTEVGRVILPSGKWTAYAVADSLCQGIDAKLGISLQQERRASLKGMTRQFPAVAASIALHSQEGAQFIHIIYHLSKFRKRQNMKSFV